MCTRIVYCWSESGQGPINQVKNINLSNYEVSSLGLALYVQHLLLGKCVYTPFKVLQEWYLGLYGTTVTAAN